jgi:hypothetical protein
MHGNQSTLLKQQDFHKQSQQSATVRVWSRERGPVEFKK